MQNPTKTIVVFLPGGIYALKLIYHVGRKAILTSRRKTNGNLLYPNNVENECFFYKGFSGRLGKPSFLSTSKITVSLNETKL